MALLFISITLLHSAATTAAATTSPAVLLSACGKNEIQNPSFYKNFISAMQYLSDDVARDGFGIAASRQCNASNAVYGFSQCFGYISSLECRLCYAKGRERLPFCIPATSGRLYLDGCFLMYADYNVSDEPAGSRCYRGRSSRNVSDPQEFKEITGWLIQNLTLKADVENYYEAGSVPGLSGNKVYGMAQCWRYVNASRCKECLERAGEALKLCLPATDGWATDSGCFVRYSARPVYGEPLQTEGSSSSATWTKLKVALGCALVTIILIMGATFWANTKGSSHGNNHEMDGVSDIIKTFPVTHLTFKNEELRKATKDYDPGNMLGRGGYGSVYKGILPNGTEIAVKRLFLSGSQWRNQFFNEINLISQVKHKNIIKLLGFSIDGSESLLVYEYLPNTSLGQILFDPLKKNALTWRRRFDILVGIAQGIAYLHGASKVRIIHRDIKASNILLDERFKPKIADFGLARIFNNDQSHMSTQAAGTLGYICPEYLVYGQLTEKADIYSFGVVLVEVLTGQRNNSISTSEESYSLMSLIWQHFTLGTLTKMLDPSVQGQCSEEQAQNVFQVGLLCMQGPPKLRPPMWKVVEMLTSEKSNLTTPTCPPFIHVNGAPSNRGVSEMSRLPSPDAKPQASVNQMSISMIQGR